MTVTFFKDVTKARRRITNKARECEREWKLKKLYCVIHSSWRYSVNSSEASRGQAL